MDKSNFLKHFTLIQYNGVPYPDGYFSYICEVAGHFDKDTINAVGAYSLHTEYSYGKRKFNSEPITLFSELMSSHKNDVPQLWRSCEWAEEFADFLMYLTKNNSPPTIVEIHPPFNDYCTFVDFIERYRIFEEKIHKIWPNTEILLENRAGTVYRGGNFLVSKAKDVAVLCEMIEKHRLKLGVVLDFPQLLTAENINPIKFNAEKYLTAITEIMPYRSRIKGIHIWGKRKVLQAGG